MNFWLIQALGLLGSLIVFSSVQFNNRKIILLAQAAACALWLVHYSLLGAATAAATNIICFARSAVFYFNDRPWAKSKLWLALCRIRRRPAEVPEDPRPVLLRRVLRERISHPHQPHARV